MVPLTVAMLWLGVLLAGSLGGHAAGSVQSPAPTEGTARTYSAGTDEAPMALSGAGSIDVPADLADCSDAKMMEPPDFQGPPTGRRVVVLGNSITWLAESDIRSALQTTYLTSVSATCGYTSAEIYTNALLYGSVDIVIENGGTNDFRNMPLGSTLQYIAATRRHFPGACFVAATLNQHTASPELNDFAGWFNFYLIFSGEYPHILDFDAYAAAHPDRFPDGVHPTVGAGTQGYAALVRAAADACQPTADVSFFYGNPGDTPFLGDWNGDGVDTPGVYRNGWFYLRNSLTQGVADVAFPYGNLGDQPVVGDWNGDGVDTVGVYRNNVFYLRDTNSAGFASSVVPFGELGDQPLVGDWNGDRIDTIGIRRGDVFHLRQVNAPGGGQVVLPYGVPSDVPVKGDWDGDGIETIGIYRIDWYHLRNSLTSGAADIHFGWGIPGDVPVVGDSNGDGVTTTGSVRSARWFIDRA